jgi:signal transduction histidine kinase
MTQNLIRFIRYLLLGLIFLLWIFFPISSGSVPLWNSVLFFVCVAGVLDVVFRKKTKDVPLGIKIYTVGGEGGLIALLVGVGVTRGSLYPLVLGVSVSLLIWMTTYTFRFFTRFSFLLDVLRGIIAYVLTVFLGSSWLSSIPLVVAVMVGWAIEQSLKDSWGTFLKSPASKKTRTDNKGLILSTLAHEIRTPLTIMQTTENILLEQIPGPLNDRQRKFLESIYINTQRLILFSENMLASIKMDRGWVPDFSTTIDIRAIIKEIVTIMQPLLNQRQQQIRYTFPALLSRPRADEAWIRQVMVNLVHNACKHTDEGGLIVISVTQDDTQVVVTVTDNGKGIIGTEREILFKEFYQEQPHSTSGQDGFGLGLTIVRSVIERHGGKVYISGTPSVGTMVSFTLPSEAPL